MYFIGTVKNLKGEGIKDATVDVVSIRLCSTAVNRHLTAC